MASERDSGVIASRRRPLRHRPHPQGASVVDDQHSDVIIIGSGAGGGTLAHRLAATGNRILLLERGDYLPRERENWEASAVFVQSKYVAKETWYGKDGRAFHPGIHYYVGGNTKMY